MTADPSFLPPGKAAARRVPGAPSACDQSWALTRLGPFSHPPEEIARLFLCYCHGRELRHAVCASQDAGWGPANVADPDPRHRSRGLPRRGDGSRGRSPGAGRAASVTRRQMLCLLVAETAFLSRFLMIIFLFTPRPLCTVVGGFHCPWLQVGVSALTPLAAVGFHKWGVWVNLKNEALLGP